MTASPTQRTLALCRRNGWPAAVVEKWNQWARIRQDLFGGLDVLALDASPGVLGIQATSDSNVGARVTKLLGLIRAGEPLRTWLYRGNRIQVWGWRKIKNRWVARRFAISIDGAAADVAVEVCDAA